MRVNHPLRAVSSFNSSVHPKDAKCQQCQPDGDDKNSGSGIYQFLGCGDFLRTLAAFCEHGGRDHLYCQRNALGYEHEVVHVTQHGNEIRD
jgi:hypothetical protein